jgi:prophage antirepressor-like protein
MTQAEAGEVIGVSAAQWGILEAGKSKDDTPNIRRWYTLLLVHHFPEYFQPTEMTPTDESPMVEAQVLAPGPEPVQDDFADQPGLIPFAYGSQKVRVKWIDGEPWFMLLDVCKAVGYKSIQHAAELIRERDIRKVECADSLGRVTEANFVSERGMSQFFLIARVPAVEQFQDWVFDEVLPSVYKTGGYQVNQPQQIQASIDPLSQVLMIGQALQTIAQQMQAQASEISSLKEQVSKVNYLEVSKTDRSEVLEIVQSEVLESKLKEKQEQKIHYRKRKELENRVSDLGWSIVKAHGGNHGEVIKGINKRIKAALRGVYSYAIARERYTDEDFALAYQVIAMVEKEIKDFPKQGEINFDGDAA